MNKTFIALALSAIGILGTAHAAPTWESASNGTLNKTFTASGTVYGKEYLQQWEWAVGSGLPNLAGALGATTRAGTHQITIPINQDVLILAGKTKEAFAVPETFVAGGVGAVPQISYTDADGQIALNKQGTENGTGKGTLNLIIKDANNQTKIGTMAVHITAAGARGIGKPGQQSGEIASICGYLNEAAMIFKGGLPTSYGSTIAVPNQATAIIEKFSGNGETFILQQINKTAPTITQLTPAAIGTGLSENMAYNDGSVVSAIYVLGIASGQNIDATVNNSVTNTTRWTAPLNIQVTYL
ncbi:hypothetical protein A9798_12450 [Edwardsiella hoshinae]|uniref:K88 pilin n=2 Tax=Edwardsiella hoshinae TaxID=93378 RepID=A0ABM6ENM6_9GAMM|nr:hypothetical protein A9798_12450 [Edwardsiella hoshinae]